MDSTSNFEVEQSVPGLTGVSKGSRGIGLSRLYFPFVMLIELAILAAFIMFMIYLIPTLDPQGYLFYGDAPHVPYLEQWIASTPLTVIRWVMFLLTVCLILPMMFTIILELVRWRINVSRKPFHLPGKDDAGGNEEVVRFDPHIKIQHLLVMVGATLAGILGLAQAFPDLPAAQWFLTEALGGLEIKRQFHHYFAYIVDFTVVYFILYLFHKYVIKKEKMRSMLFSFRDIKDLINMNLYIFGLRKEEPSYGRYTFGQKLDFYLIVLGIPTLSLTGLSMHYTAFSEPIITSMGVAIAAVLHRSVAVFLAWFILSVHLYYAHLAPGLFPANTVIFTGKMPKPRYEHMFPLDRERLEPKAAPSRDRPS